jgi:hypothetical protein
MDAEAAEDILENQDEAEDRDPEDEASNKALPSDPSMLYADGEVYDLKDPDQVSDLQENLQAKRNDLKAGQLKRYENHSTEWGGGGRSRLLYDSVRANLAQQYHAGEHDMTWQEQHEEAEKVKRIVAIRNRHKY